LGVGVFASGSIKTLILSQPDTKRAIGLAWQITESPKNRILFIREEAIKIYKMDLVSYQAVPELFGTVLRLI